jgi:hypothetical protein
MWRIKGVITLYLDIYLCRKRNTILYASRNGDLEIDCFTYIQRVLLVLGRKIYTDICLYRFVTYSPHKELYPLLQSYPFRCRVIPLTVGHNVKNRLFHLYTKSFTCPWQENIYRYLLAFGR